ncbi:MULTISPECIES: nitroreductase family deazaflavin-dependent oxidoreductase [unclassified Streptomyces]|uniref:nitroreductase family deazaflavin-dependent oxidoreductase n=1 Tax=unclassified Streptomyces TaxID=2593676 RepID=UPI001F044533|nr:MULTISPECIES: nitroreductase family deazaflavin-dependent oxidoreductase [unclassified Streptomyces]MCH0562532.1 nitroreductase family deazaflavin-dependent oxidoreductase [Streptomyces sp. MUM 2J]MCH0572636.1 nitroreductase family deazaflavin-dependent oxidoreductase [Streptomyces sp. MUM 136J]
MFNPLKGGPPASGIRRAVLRAPIRLYRMGLGGLLGQRMVLLTHTGRKSGRPRQVVLEVVARLPEPGAYLIASGYGERSQWLRNILATPRVRYQVGRHRYRGTAVPLPPEESGRALADYARRHPRLAERLMRSVGHDPRTEADFESLGADRRTGVPLIALRPSERM